MYTDHRAVLRMMEARDFDTFLADLAGDVADTLRVDALRLIVESERPQDAKGLEAVSDVLRVTPVGTVDDYVAQGRAVTERVVTLRQVIADEDGFYGGMTSYIRSEACLKLDLGTGNLPGMLIMGSEDPHHFTPQHGTDLLTFFAGVFERALRRWLG